MSARTKTPRPRLALEALESRLTPAVTAVVNRLGDLVVTGTSANDIVSVSTTFVRGVWNYQVADFASVTLVRASRVIGGDVYFHGHDGNDLFRNKTSLRTWAYGMLGDDVLIGGANADHLFGGDGRDTLSGEGGADVLRGGFGDDELHGGSGADQLYGDFGDDELHGDAGPDYLYGGYDDDALYGDGGADWLYGGWGEDTLVSVGGGADTSSGGPDLDSVWMDLGTDTLTDGSVENGNKAVHKVGQFYRYSYDGGATSTYVSKELNGQDLADPSQHGDLLFGNTTVNVKGHPLFAAGGPTKDDVFQGAAGDCYLMARLSAYAEVDPTFIRNMVADLGDGTYAVRFYRNGVPDYVRVDADLWASPDGLLRYANYSQGGSIWVAIVEKAYAFWRDRMGSYPSIDGGKSSPHVSEDVTGVLNPTHQIANPLADQVVVNWYAAGSPPGAVADAVRSGALALLDWMKVRLGEGKAVTTSGPAGLSDTSPITLNPLRGQHIYMVDAVLTNVNGTPTGFRLRDPYGQYRVITDLTRIYYLSPGAAAATV